jgi:N4-gp56 family major capsid protein
MPTTLTGLTAQQRNSYNKVLLARVKPYTPGFKDARKARIPTREGTTMEWRVLGGATVATTGSGLALATTPLVEATPPAETALTAAKITKAVSQYGAFVKASDLLVHQSIDPVWAEIYALLGEQAGQTLHTLLMNDLAGGTNIQYASTATSRVTVAAAMLMIGAEIREATRTLERAKVSKFGDGFYHGLMHTDVAFDLRNDADFKNSMVYNAGAMGGGNSMLTNELRDWMGVRWMITTDAPAFGNVGATGAPVFGTLVYGPGWYGTVDLEAQGMGSVSEDGVSGLRIRAVPVEQETKDDPLGQFGTAGWKGSFGAKILQEFRGVRIESSATA